jgi:hypothetical protein
MNWLRGEEWPCWQAGLLLGVLNLAAFFTADYYLSVSTTFSRAAGMAVGLVAPEHVAEVYPLIQDNLLKLGDYGKLTLPSLIGTEPWILIVPIVVVFGGTLYWLEMKGQ